MHSSQNTLPIIRCHKSKVVEEKASHVQIAIGYVYTYMYIYISIHVYTYVLPSLFICVYIDVQGERKEENVLYVKMFPLNLLTVLHLSFYLCSPQCTILAFCHPRHIGKATRSTRFTLNRTYRVLLALWWAHSRSCQRHTHTRTYVAP